MSLIPLRLLRAMMASPLRAIGRSHWDPFFSPAEPIYFTSSKLPEIMMPDFFMKPIASEYSDDTRIDKDGFKITMNLEYFKPNEITVKTVDNIVVIEGKHQEQQDEHGLISREFVRKYSLPDGYDPKKITSTFSSDGILNINAPAPEGKIEEPKEHIIKVEHVSK